MSDEIKVTVDGVEISYMEGSDKWQCEIGGKLRSFASLTNAKVAINETPKEKKKPFPRFTAFCLTGWLGSAEVEKVEVTSLAEPDYYGSRIEFWVIDKSKKRRKVRQDELIVISDATSRSLKDAKKLYEQADSLREDAGNIIAKLPRVKVPKECEEEK